MATVLDITKAFAIMSLAWPNYKAKDGTIEVYASMLEDIPPDVLVAAARSLIASGGDFFPSVSAWRQTSLDIMLNKNGTPTAIEAWEEAVRECNRCGDYWRYQKGKKYPEYSHPLIQACVQAIGYAEILETENIDIVRAHFLKAFESLRQRNDVNQRMLPDVKAVEQKYIDANVAMKQLSERLEK